MKSLVLASALGTLAGTFAVPMVAGPIHFHVTKPHNMFGWVPVGGPGQTVSPLAFPDVTFAVADFFA